MDDEKTEDVQVSEAASSQEDSSPAYPTGWKRFAICATLALSLFLPALVRLDCLC